MIKSGFMHVSPLPKLRVVSKTHGVSNNKNIEEIKLHSKHTKNSFMKSFFQNGIVLILKLSV